MSLKVDKVWSAASTHSRFDFMSPAIAFTSSGQAARHRRAPNDAGITGEGAHVIGSASPVTENIKITTGLKNLYMNASTLVAIVEEYLYALQVGGFYETPADCIFAALYAGNVTAMRMTLDDIADPVYETVNTGEGVAYVVKSLTDAVFLMYEKHVLGILPSLLETTARQAANDALQKFLDQPFQERCPRIVYPTSGPPTIIDLHSATLFTKQRDNVQKEVLDNRPSPRTRTICQPPSSILSPKDRAQEVFW